MDALIQLASSLGPTGVLAWYCWYVTSNTLPRLVKEFREETWELREDARAERGHHDAQTARMAEAIEQMVAHCKGD